jgi:TPP-dependent 2-oxoacid decarboxylase
LIRSSITCYFRATSLSAGAAMAGVSSYAPKEIEFVLKSIVQKHKPAYIIDEFVRRFNKTLNQNQIRYIKNKYGKDPSFG